MGKLDGLSRQVCVMLNAVETEFRESAVPKLEFGNKSGKETKVWRLVRHPGVQRPRTDRS